ncbi:hypothetical protein P879_07064 [Paragonimus westermani]|uniref:ELM2 domain-containing protein n=1 Tax=Paragonimus westermani TaxID=34504 RepID=A0A8T0D2I8_9TREM|nr:hypothetical protein P879_07064 [Paragonimus westermani]
MTGIMGHNPRNGRGERRLEPSDRTAAYEEETASRETLLWYPENLDERDPKNIESLNLLMKIACSPAVRNCGLNMEYTFHLLCKYKGNLEMTLHALLYETLVVYDYVYAGTFLLFIHRP